MRAVAIGVQPSRAVSVPLWREIADDIAARIAAGVLRPGDTVASQAELATAWQCSLAPVKRAIAYLDATGVLVARQGMRARVPLPKGR
jgi:DNA-binding GntR family transcriptional regulator